MKNLLFTTFVFIALAAVSAAKEPASAKTAPLGVKPLDAWHCPETYPIKGNINPRKHTMIYHIPGGQYYDKTMPERCYATEDDAKKDGFRKSKR